MNGDREPQPPADEPAAEVVEDPYEDAEGTVVPETDPRKASTRREFQASIAKHPDLLLPPAMELRQLAELDSSENLIDWYVRKTDEELEHRRDVDRRWMRFQDRGQIFSFALALVVVLGGIGLIAAGQSVAGLALVLPGLAAVTLAMIWGEKSDDDDKPSTEQDSGT